VDEQKYFNNIDTFVANKNFINDANGKLECLSGIFSLPVSIQHLSEATTEKGN
jgi:hypothetical protein